MERSRALSDAKVAAEAFKQHRDEIDGIVVVLPNFGDELGVVETLNRAKLDVPVLIQACDDEDPNKLGVKERRDAFCGKFSVCNNLYQYGIPFTDTTYHTYSIDSDVFAHDLDFFSRVCRVVKGLTTMRVGAIGARPAPSTPAGTAKSCSRITGITVVTVDLSEMIAAARNCSKKRPEKVQQKLGRDKGLRQHSRLYQG